MSLVFFLFLFETESCHVGRAGFEPLRTSDLPCCILSKGTAAMCHLVVACLLPSPLFLFVETGS